MLMSSDVGCVVCGGLVLCAVGVCSAVRTYGTGGPK